ncbi:hypothetical protein [Acinetobacter sp. SEK541]|uniref:hypothetical protein n=1 Tax=Acinetobacter sp. SEK541 TaxID=3379131 RepID=UPI003A102528
MKVIYGKVQKLQCIDAIVGELPKLRSQATTTALVSMFAESGGMGAAATLAGVNGFPGYYIHFYIDDIEFYAAFTGIFFNEGESMANSNMRCDSLKSLMIINKLSKFL